MKIEKYKLSSNKYNYEAQASKLKKEPAIYPHNCYVTYSRIIPYTNLQDAT